MAITLYSYSKCGTCREAMKSLKSKDKEVNLIELFDHPPTVEQLQDMIRQSGLPIRKFFNVSGEVYREMGLKDRIPDLSEQEMLQLLASNGRLIKRPLATDGIRTTVGFKEAEYAEVWG
jgi:arsenate reductase